MKYLHKNIFEGFDWVLVCIISLLSFVGLLAIYAASVNAQSFAGFFYKQIIWLAISYVFLFTIAFVDYRFLVKGSVFFHLFLVLLLIYVLYQGTGNKVKRWIDLGFFSFQPSEFIKITLILYLGYYFKKLQKSGYLDFFHIVWPLILTVIPFYLILKQPDLGTAVLLIFIACPIIFVAGIKLRYIFLAILCSTILIPVAWFKIFKPYQKERILTLLNPDKDPLGVGYHITQSKISIGSGGFYGKGFLEGKQSQLNFLPAKHTDFIFSVFSEEWGFVGAIAVVALYFFLIMRCLGHAKKIKYRDASLIIVGITFLVASHIIINLCMIMGLVPVVGVSLPFMSYGGSSLLTMFICVGIILSIVKKNA